MTLPLLTVPLGVREADLRDVRDRTRIDGFVRAQPAATPFHLAGWTAATAQATRQRPRYLIAERGDGAITGVLPLTEIRSAIFGKALVSTGFGTDGGILAEQPAAIDALAAAAWGLAEARDIPGVELRGGPVPDGEWHVQSGQHVAFSKLLADSDAAELAALSKRRRYTVRKAIGHDFAITSGNDGAAQAAHYAVYAESVRNLGTPVFPQALFTAVLEAFQHDADILTASHRGQPMASALNLYFRGAVYPYWAGNTIAGRPLFASDALYFALMRHAHVRGCTRFDFGRSKVGSGSADYKRHLGFAERPLHYAVQTRAGETPRAVNPASPKYRLQIAAWKRLPLWLANALGPQLARGLG